MASQPTADRLDIFRPAKGQGRPVLKLAPLLNLAHGPKRVDSKTKGGKRVVTPSIRGDPRGNPPRTPPLRSAAALSHRLRTAHPRRRPPRSPPTSSLARCRTPLRPPLQAPTTRCQCHRRRRRIDLFLPRPSSLVILTSSSGFQGPDLARLLAGSPRHDEELDGSRESSPFPQHTRVWLVRPYGAVGLLMT